MSLLDHNRPPSDLSRIAEASMPQDNRLQMRPQDQLAMHKAMNDTADHAVHKVGEAIGSLLPGFTGSAFSESRIQEQSQFKVASAHVPNATIHSSFIEFAPIAQESAKQTNTSISEARAPEKHLVTA